MQGFVALGEEVAGYRLESFIGRGGMAVVYRAHDLRLGRQVALKVLAPELAENERFRLRFARESKLAAAIDHPNIIPIYEAGETAELLYIVMRYVDGMDLKALLEREGRLEPHHVVELFSQVAGALDAAHAHGLVHRDVKPGNILVASGVGGELVDHVYLTDFGLTKKSLSLSDLTTVGHFVGTIDYVAPEQISSKPVDGRADIYALGCVLFQCLSGTLPFERDDDAATLWAHMLDPVPPLTSFRPDLPPSVNDVFYRAMAKSPEERYPTCRAVVAALRTELGSWRAAETVFGHDAATAVPVTAPRPALPDRDDLSASGVATGASRPSPPAAVAAVASGAAAEQPPQSANRLRRLALPLLGAALAAAVAVVLLTVLPTHHAGARSGGTTFQRYVGTNDTVPVTLDHPAAWTPHGHSYLFLVFSPQDLTDFFNGLPQAWARVDPLLKHSPDSMVGVYLSDNSGGFDMSNPTQLADDIQSTLALEGDATVGSGTPVSVARRSALRFDGTLRQRGGPGRLRFSFYVVPVDTQQQNVLQVMTFASPGSFNKNQPLFDRVLASLNVDRVHPVS